MYMYMCLIFCVRYVIILQEDLQPLHCAASNSQLEIIQLLVEVYNVPPNTAGTVPLGY